MKLKTLHTLNFQPLRSFGKVVSNRLIVTQTRISWCNTLIYLYLCNHQFPLWISCMFLFTLRISWSRTICMWQHESDASVTTLVSPTVICSRSEVACGRHWETSPPVCLALSIIRPVVGGAGSGKEETGRQRGRWMIACMHSLLWMVCCVFL